MRWRVLLKCTAFILLFGAAVDIFLVDLIVPDSCDEATSQTGSTPRADHECFCCCAHVILTGLNRIEPIELSARDETAVARSVTSVEPARIEHPPRI